MSTAHSTAIPISVQVEDYRRSGLTDAQVIQAALNDAQARGTEQVLFATRTYVVDREVALHSNVSLSGNGAVLTWADQGAPHGFFRIEDDNSVAISGFTFRWKGGRTPTDNIQTHAVVVQNSRSVDLNDNIFENSKAIHIAGSSDVGVHGNRIIGGAEGVVIGMLRSDLPQASSRNIAIVDNYFEGQGREAVDLNSDAEDVIIARNHFIGRAGGRAGKETIDELVDVGGGAMRGITVADNLFDGRNSYAYALRVKLGVDDLTINGNQFNGLFDSVGGSAVKLENVTDFLVVDNTATGRTTGVAVVGSQRGLVTGNDLTAVTTDISVSGTNRDVSTLRQVGDSAGSGTTLHGNGGADSLMGANGSDRATGGGGADTLVGRNGDDTLDGEAGNDLLIGELGQDLLLGREGADHLLGGDDRDTLAGGGGNDTLHGGEGADLLIGDDGDDSAQGGPGDDTVLGGAGNDTLYGGEGNDRLLGEGGDDFLVIGSSSALLDGGSGNDTLDARFSRSSILVGGEGDDLYLVGSQGDTAMIEDAAGGWDTVWAFATGSGFALSPNIEALYLMNGTIFGLGNSSDNLLVGNSGDNYLSGGAGADTLNGIYGNDRLAGGAGADVFVVNTENRHTLITDFEPGIDRILLLGNGFDSAAAAAEFVATSTGVELRLPGATLELYGMTPVDLRAPGIWLG